MEITKEILIVDIARERERIVVPFHFFRCLSNNSLPKELQFPSSIL